MSSPLGARTQADYIALAELVMATTSPEPSTPGLTRVVSLPQSDVQQTLMRRILRLQQPRCSRGYRRWQANGPRTFHPSRLEGYYQDRLCCRYLCRWYSLHRLRRGTSSHPTGAIGTDKQSTFVVCEYQDPGNVYLGDGDANALFVDNVGPKI